MPGSQPLGSLFSVPASNRSGGEGKQGGQPASEPNSQPTRQMPSMQTQAPFIRHCLSPSRSPCLETSVVRQARKRALPPRVWGETKQATNQRDKQASMCASNEVAQASEHLGDSRPASQARARQIHSEVGTDSEGRVGMRAGKQPNQKASKHARQQRGRPSKQAIRSRFAGPPDTWPPK